MAELKRYKIVDLRTNEVIFEGIGSECAKKIGVSYSIIHSAASYGYHICNKRYSVIDCAKGEEPTKTIFQAAQEWDAFCEPIRKKYNIPVYKAKPEVRG